MDNQNKQANNIANQGSTVYTLSEHKESCRRPIPIGVVIEYSPRNVLEIVILIFYEWRQTTP